jgi:hypothetical protein
MHGARSALADAAAILAAGEVELLAKHPQQGRIRLGVELAHLAVHCQLWHRPSPCCWELDTAAAAVQRRGGFASQDIPDQAVLTAPPAQRNCQRRATC